MKDKPPLGVMPEKLWKEQRIEALTDAINRKIMYYRIEGGKTGTFLERAIFKLLSDSAVLKWVDELKKLKAEVKLLSIT